MPDVSETVTEADERDRESHSHLNSAVAILVALTATFMALCNVKDGNVTQAMTQAQAQAVDTWSYYQSKSIKGHLAEQTVDQLRIQRALAPPALLPMLDAKIAEYAKQAQRENSEKKKIQAQAEGYQKEYDHLNFRDDQFDMSDAALSVAIALFGVTALTQKRWLILVAIAFMLFDLETVFLFIWALGAQPLTGFMLLTFFIFAFLLVAILLYVYRARLLEAVTE